MNNDEINSRIARAMGFDTITVDVLGIGESLYLYDPTAKHTGEHSTSTRLVGGGWEKITKDNGDPFEFWGRPCPDWAGNWRDTGQLLEKGNIYLLPVRGGFIAECLEYAPDPSNGWFERSFSGCTVQEDPNLAVCMAWLAEHESGETS